MSIILLVEDDKALSNGIALALKSSDVAIKQSYSLKEAREFFEKMECGLVILDVNLPDGSGLAFLQDIRQESEMPVILLTANDMETDIVTGLEMGADDYITKPFSLAVLRARVNTQLRRGRRVNHDKMLIDDFIFDFGKMEFFKKEEKLDFSKTEQKLLRVLLENKGITLSRSDLVDRIWTDGAEYVDENALSVTIKRLRDKLEDTPSKPEYIKTVYGVGYTWLVH